MKKIVINSDNRRFNISSIVVGYLEENKEEVLEFEIPEKYAEYGKKACFSANGQTFAKNFDDIISNKLTITRDISQFKELDMTIEFFKIENEDKVVARTSILHILIENAIICDDDVKPDEPKIIVLDNLIDEVTKLDLVVTKNEKKREEYYQEIQKKVDNGDFNGAIFTPSVDTDGNISWSNDKNLSNPTTQNIKGPKGEKGDTYNLTEQDKKDISSMTVESSESMFNQYYNGKLEDFNSNAETKTTTFDNNYTSKLQSFNENSNSKTTEFNDNATNKTTEYNNNAISKVTEFNTNADNKIAEYDLHSQELDNKIVSTRNELERVKNDVLETGTDTDTFIHLEDSAMAEYQELSVDGVCEQVTSSGKQLFNINKRSNIDSRYVITHDDWIHISYDNSNGSSILFANFYTENLNLKPNIFYSLVLEIKNVEGSGTLCLTSNYQTDGQISTPISKNFSELKNSTKYIYNILTKESFETVGNFGLRTYVRFGSRESGSIEFRLSVLEDTTITTDNFIYEPYTREQPTPSPDYPQEIKTIENSLSVTSCNKNLFDTTKIVSGTSKGISYSVDNNGIIILNGTTNGNSIEIPLNTNISLNGTYTYIPKISDITKINNIALKDDSFNNVFLSLLPTTSNVNAIVTKIVLYVSSGIVFNNDTLSIQILKGTQSTETDFEQHLETQIQANLPEGEFIGKINDKYKDTLKVEYNEEDGQYHLNLYKNIGKVVLDLNTISIECSHSDGTFQFRFNKYLENTSSLSITKCSHSKYWNYNFSDNGCFIGYNGFPYLLVKENDFGFNSNMTIEEAINYLKQIASEITYYYSLFTPYILDLGVIDMPITYNEITNLFTDSDLMPTINAKYYRNFISTVRNLQVNEKALKQELADINARLSALETAQTSVVSESEVIE